MKLKQELLKICTDRLAERLLNVKKRIADIQSSLDAETKSSAGDKHETGRAMLQLEREKAGVQLKALEQDQVLLSRIKPDENLQRVALGSIVLTDQTSYFIAMSAGQISLGDQSFYAISIQSPIGQLMRGKTPGQGFSFNGRDFRILKIL
jgi:transcription elongation GreA/GreB family factor